MPGNKVLGQMKKRWSAKQKAIAKARDRVVEAAMEDYEPGPYYASGEDGSAYEREPSPLEAACAVLAELERKG